MKDLKISFFYLLVGALFLAFLPYPANQIVGCPIVGFGFGWGFASIHLKISGKP